MSFGTFTLTGHIDVIDGSPAVGPVVIEAIPSVIIDSAGNKLKLGPKNVYLDTVGDFSVSLPTNSTTGNSTTIGFRVKTKLKSGLRDLEPVEFYARPIGATIDLSDITTSVVEPIGDTAANVIAAQAAQAAAEAAAAAAEAVGTTTDELMAAVADDEGSDFRAVLDGIFDVTSVTGIRDLTDTTFKDNLDDEIALVAGPAVDSLRDLSDTTFKGNLDNAYLALATRTKHAPALRMWFPEAEGGYGDGTHDDAAAISAAVAACSTAGGGTVFLGAASYNVSTSIVLRSNVELRGAVVTTIKPHTSTYAFSFIRNYRATQSSGANDNRITIRDLRIDGLSTGNTLDNRKGYGIELYGATDTLIERVRLVNIPLSGIEVSGNYAGVAVNSVASGTPPNAATINTTIRDVIGQHIGWQEPFLADTDLTQWGDAGFGIIGRSNVRGFTCENVKMYDCEVNGLGVGQMNSQNNTADPPTTAHCSDVQWTDCLVDQSAASGTVSAPSFRIAFTARATLTNCIAIGNAGSVGFNVRAAGTSFTRRVTLVGCISENNVAGFQVTGKDAVTSAQHVALAACIAKGNSAEGFRTQNAHVSFDGCHAVTNGTQGFWLQYVSGASITSVFDSSLTGCHAKDNGTVGSTVSGIVLDGCSNVTVTGCVLANTTSGGSRTQAYGIREINGATANSINGNSSRNHVTADLAPGSTASKWHDNIGQTGNAYKAADQTMSASTTYVNDTDLTVNLLPNSRYRVESFVIVDGPTAADIKLKWTVPSGCTGNWQPDGLQNSVTGTNGSTVHNQIVETGSTVLATAGGTPLVCTPWGVFTTGAAGGALTLMWAQSVSDAGTTKVMAGSMLRATRLD